MNVEIDITNVIIKTNRLVIRAFKESDLNDFYEYASVEGVGEHAGWTHHKSIDESKYILDMFIKEKKTLAIELNNKVIGSVGIEKYNENELVELKDYKARELGYVLSKDYWGQGIMVEALKAIIDYLFNEVKLDYITCGYFKENYQSKRVQEKLGFKYVKDVMYQSIAFGEKETALNMLSNKDWLKN